MMRTEFMTWHEAQATLTPEWRELVRAGGFNPSLDPAWMDTAVRSHRCERDVLVAAARVGSRLVGVLPLICSRQRVHGLPMRTVDLASNLVSYHPEIVASEAPSQLLADVLARAHGGKWDLFRANQIPCGSTTVAVLEEYFSRQSSTTFTIPGETSPFIAIEGSWDRLLSTRSTKFRTNRKRWQRRVSEYGATQMRWFEGSVDTTELLRDIYAIERRSWKATKGIAITDRAFEQRYHDLLLPMLSSNQALLANVLYVEQRPVAYVLCCHWNSWVGQLKTSYDAALQDAGARAIDESVQRAFELGAREYDFLGDAAPHKTKWTELSRPHLSLTAWGRGPLPRALGFAKRLREGIVRRLPRESPATANETGMKP